ncbi:MAG: hypothetical protein KA282_02590, partial [Clostridia bacterium]|nr:hypothetical protein [Clostridia bacterium]
KSHSRSPFICSFTIMAARNEPSIFLIINLSSIRNALFYYNDLAVQSQSLEPVFSANKFALKTG